MGLEKFNLRQTFQNEDITNASRQQAVWQDVGLVSSEILLNFEGLWLVRAAVKAATSPSCKNVRRQRATARWTLTENVKN